MSFEQKSIALIRRMKSGKEAPIPISNMPGYTLMPLTADSVNDANIEILARWRQENIGAYLKIFKVTLEGTKKWLELGVLERPDRLMFMVVDGAGKQVGHLGLSSFDFKRETFEIDNIVKGDKKAPRELFFNACDTLIRWSSAELKPSAVMLRVLNENSRAIALYHRLKFRPDSLIPLTKTISGDATEWNECTSERDTIDRFFMLMSKKNNDY